jgi:A/G-specific adenine glycosylase
MRSNPPISSVSQLLLDWFEHHGRKHLPWQQDKTPYRVWVSEIMLQQTQVKTVIPYFQTFMQHFPHLAALAQAKEDEVLHIWTGLGYYSRARNLHRAAIKILNEFDGHFPHLITDLITLPGIGRSTAGAIRSLAFNQPAAILDGNVKRVLARFHGITQPINEKKAENTLWELAEKHLPHERAADYTQAIMDLGATCCTPKLPACHACPLSHDCVAHAKNITAILPIKQATRTLPIKTSTFLIIQQKGILLEKRPNSGIWGGLFSAPEIPEEPDLALIKDFCQKHFDFLVKSPQILPHFRHTFTHYHLDIHPVLVRVSTKKKINLTKATQIWYNPHQLQSVGLPKPIQLILRYIDSKL